jgi:hypothetical protein
MADHSPHKTISDRIDWEDPRFEKAAADFQLDVLSQYFEEDKNPLFVFEAYAICRKRERPLPYWVLGYLDQIAEKLLSLGERKKTFRGRTSAQVYEALGMSQRHPRNVFVRYQISNRERMIWARVESLICKGKKVTDAFEEVLRESREEGWSPACNLQTVKKAYYKMDRDFNEFRVYDKSRRGPKRKRRG